MVAVGTKRIARAGLIFLGGCFVAGLLGCTVIMDDVAKLGERSTDDNDTIGPNGSDSDTGFVSELCNGVSIFKCNEDDLWCFSDESTPLAVAQRCSNGCEGDRCVCENGWSGENCDITESCLGVWDFSFCHVDTTSNANGDLSYDICVNDDCISPASCDSAACNGNGVYFATTVNNDFHFVVLENEGQVDSDGQVVVDEVTNLFWMKCPLGQSGASCESISGSSAFSWQLAVQYCNSLEYAGFDDWYLPSEFELLTILDFSQSGTSSVDEAFFPATPALDFWTSNSFENDSAYAKRVFFNAGLVRATHPDGLDDKVGLKSEAHPVRCVRRAAISQNLNRFTRSSGDEPVVTDRLSSVSWMGCESGKIGADCSGGTVSSLPLLDADSHCSTLTYGGHNDWRLPTPMELFSLYGQTAAFPNMNGPELWSSYLPERTDWGFYVDIDLWLIGSRDASSTHPVICIREGV